MSFNLAFWVGDAPADDLAAIATFQRQYAEHMRDDRHDPAPALLAFLADVTRTFPDLVDLPDDQVDDGVWSDGPLTNNASGPMLYLGIVWSRVDDVVPVLVERARTHGLVVFDPQAGKRL